MSLESIRNLVNDDLLATDQFIIHRLESHIPLVKQVVEYVLSCGGKRIRPLILLLSAQAISTNVEKHIDLAAVIELIHTATLLHDDVVDHSTLRRGNKTANTIWGNNSSVLIGDFLYSRAFQIVVDLKHAGVLDIFANATHLMAEGEILQLVNCHHPDTTETFYYDIIERKTAKLFEIAAQLGGLLTNDDEQINHALRDYGLNLGFAYQLIDDALDYGDSPQVTGKNVGQDLADGKTTLPLIYAMSKSRGSDLALIRDAITDGCSNQLERILTIIESTGAIKYTAEAAKCHADKAKQALAPLKASAYRNALESMADFVVSRTY